MKGAAQTDGRSPGSAVGVDPWRLFPARVVRRREEIEAVFTIDIELTDERARRDFRFLPGQFNMLYVHGVGECPISIASSPAEPAIQTHTIRIVGDVTGALARLRPGDALGLRGPFGSHWPIERARGRNLIMVAGGIGLPPLRPAIHAVAADRGAYERVTLIYGAKMPSALLYTDEFDAWREAGIEVAVTVDRADEGWTGNRGVVTSMLEKLRLRGPGNVVLLCGPEIMMQYGVGVCRNARLPEENVFVSIERNMMCAIGFCGHCQLGPDFVCKDGPVLPYSRVKRFFAREGF
jgi:NAD(P)H-flavin reductase